MSRVKDKFDKLSKGEFRSSKLAFVTREHSDSSISDLIGTMPQTSASWAVSADAGSLIGTMPQTSASWAASADAGNTPTSLLTNYDNCININAGALIGYDAGNTLTSLLTHYDNCISIKAGAPIGYDAGNTPTSLLTHYDACISIKAGTPIGYDAGNTPTNLLTNYDNCISIKAGTPIGYDGGLTSTSLLTNCDNYISIKTGTPNGYDAGITSLSMLNNNNGVSIEAHNLTGYHADILGASLPPNPSGANVLTVSPYRSPVLALEHYVIPGDVGAAVMERPHAYPGNIFTRLRFEVPLPLQYNDGKDVPAATLEEALSEIAYRFGGYQAHEVKGGWLHEGRIIGDDHLKLVVDAPDLNSTRQWMELFTQRWCRRLKQYKLYMVSYEVEVRGGET